MIEEFYVKFSPGFFIFLVGLHIIVFGVAINFQIPSIVKLLIIVFMLVISYAKFKQIKDEFCILKFDSKTKTWKMSKDGRNWHCFDVVNTIYLNDWFVWLVFKNSTKHTQGVIIGRDSLPIERFMQLRRCILCPEVIHQRQV